MKTKFLLITLTPLFTLTSFAATKELEQATRYEEARTALRKPDIS